MDNAPNHRNQWALAKCISKFKIPETMLSMLILTVHNGKFYLEIFKIIFGLHSRI